METFRIAGPLTRSEAIYCATRMTEKRTVVKCEKIGRRIYLVTLA